MDPNANVEEQNRIITRRRRGERYDRARLRELREALRDWLASGGFRPTIPFV